MKAALQLASFGVLIFATVHTNSAAATIDRYVNAFPADQQPQIRGLLADSLVGVVAQQLLRRADGKGRVAAHEILIGNVRARLADPRGQDPADRRASSSRGPTEGMQTMDVALEQARRNWRRVRAADALEKAIDKEAFVKLPHVARELAARGVTRGSSAG